MLPSAAILHENFINILHDIALLHSLGVRIIIVYGIREHLIKHLQSSDLADVYQDNLRITDAKTLSCVLEIAGKLQTEIMDQLSVDIVNSPLSGAKLCVISGNFVTAKPCGVIDGVDFQYTGKVRKIDVDNMQKLLNHNMIILQGPSCPAPTGEAFNLSSLDIAAQIAISIKADKLILFNPYAGFTNQNGDLVREIVLPAIGKDQQADNPLNHLIKIAADACKNGVDRCHLISFKQNGALLNELFTRTGEGTLIAPQSLEVLRKANIDDIGGILDLIRPLEQQGILVKRSRDLLERDINNFYVISIDGLIVACCALYPQNEEQISSLKNVKKSSIELACLVVHPDYQKSGYADKLLNFAEKKAKNEGINQLFALTTHTEHWFLQRGFNNGSKEDLPSVKANSYNQQRNSKILIKTLS